MKNWSQLGKIRIYGESFFWTFKWHLFPSTWTQPQSSIVKFRNFNWNWKIFYYFNGLNRNLHVLPQFHLFTSSSLQNFVLHLHAPRLSRNKTFPPFLETLFYVFFDKLNCEIWTFFFIPFFIIVWSPIETNPILPNPSYSFLLAIMSDLNLKG